MLLWLVMYRSGSYGLDIGDSYSTSAFLITFRDRLHRVLNTEVSDRDSELYLYKIMSYTALASCKFLRPVFVYKSFLSLGCASDSAVESLMPFAIAIELMHVNTLLLDDLPAMDNDDFRRGQPSCHRVYGEAKTILASSGLLALAFGMVTRAESCGHDVRCEVVRLLSDALGISGVVGGQYLDVGVQSCDEDALLNILQKKTACLFSVACEIAAVVAEASDFREALGRFGYYLGMAFQIKDDIEDHVKGKDINNIAEVLGLERAESLFVSYVNSSVELVKALDIPRPEDLLELISILEDL